MVENTVFVIWFFVNIQVGIGFTEDLCPLQGIHSIADCRLRTAIDIAFAIGIVNVILFFGKSTVYPGLNRTQHFFIASSVCQPKHGSILVYRLGSIACREIQYGKNNNNKSFNVLHIGIYLINLEEGAPRYDDLRPPKSISIFSITTPGSTNLKRRSCLPACPKSTSISVLMMLAACHGPTLPL